MTEQNEPQLSKCCHALTKLNTPDSFDSPEGQTMYTICTKCEKPCDLVGGEPQLSAEMEKRFDEEFFAESPKLSKAGKHFLATALEEQRLKYEDKVKSMPHKYIDDRCWVYRHDVLAIFVSL